MTNVLRLSCMAMALAFGAEAASAGVCTDVSAGSTHFIGDCTEDAQHNRTFQAQSDTMT